MSTAKLQTESVLPVAKGSAVAANIDQADRDLRLGNALHAQNRWTEAVQAYQSSLRLAPDNPEALFRLGNTLHRLQQLPEAENAYRRALAFKPDHSDARYNLATVLYLQKRRQEAATTYLEVLRLKPNCARTHNNLASLYKEMGRLDAAAAGYRAALRIEPDKINARDNLGLTLLEQNRLEDALATFDDVLARQPDYVRALNNRAATLMALGRPREALADYDKAIFHDSNYADANFNRSLAHLLLGNLQEGWEGYEWRFRRQDPAPRRFPQPMWDGSPLETEVLLVHAEQGLGDTIQFARYLPLVTQRCKRILLECQPALVPILRKSSIVDSLIPKGSPLPPFDKHIPLMSLPRIFRTTLATIPGGVPYVSALPSLVHEWGARIGTSAKRRIGLVWAGSAAHKGNRRRSITLEKFQPLAGVSGIQLFSLQRGPEANQLNSAPHGLNIVHLESDEYDINDTAAMISNLDLVITVDTMIAHLAGAIGKPVWTLLAYAPDWRWLLDRSDSPWYSTMRLFRQVRNGDWDSVIAEVVSELEKLDASAPRPQA